MSFLRTLFLVTGFLCFLVAVGLFLGDDSRSLSPSHGTKGHLWGLWETYSRMESEARREEALEAVRKMLFDAITARDRIAEGLIAGRLLFAEAVAQFRAVDAKQRPHLRISTNIVGPGSSVEERWANYVFNRTRALLSSQVGEEAVLARLATERDEYLAQLSSRQPTNTNE